MKRLLTTALLATAVGFAAPAMAQDLTGFYIGGSVGQTDYSIDDCFGQCDKTDTGFKIFGGYMFTPNIGAELAYGAYGKAKVNVDVATPAGVVNVLGEGKSSGWSAFVVGAYPIEQWNLFGKLGFARLDNELSVTVPGFGAAENSDSSFEFAWGLGVSYSFTKNFAVRGEWEQLRWKFEDDKDNLRFLSVGVQYSF
jgi:OOP family OmpA-OmpF porin